MSSHEEIGKRVREIRMALKLDQSDFGLLIGIRQGSVSNIEVGAKRLTFSEVLRISEATNLPLSAFNPRAPMPQIKTTIQVLRNVEVITTEPTQETK